MWCEVMDQRTRAFSLSHTLHLTPSLSLAQVAVSEAVNEGALSAADDIGHKVLMPYITPSIIMRAIARALIRCSQRQLLAIGEASLDDPKTISDFPCCRRPAATRSRVNITRAWGVATS